MTILVLLEQLEKYVMKIQIERSKDRGFGSGLFVVKKKIQIITLFPFLVIGLKK